MPTVRDALPHEAEALMDAVRNRSKEELLYIVYTHDNLMFGAATKNLSPTDRKWMEDTLSDEDWRRRNEAADGDPFYNDTL